MRLIVAASMLIVIGCGGTSPTQPPPTNTPPPAQTNRSPSITALSMTAFGIQQLSTFTFSANATDPDGDPLSFSWDIAGTQRSGTSGTLLFSTGGTGVARVTVSDGKGGTAIDSREFVVGSLTGRWNGTWNGFTFTTNLTQNNGGVITGDYVDQVGPCVLDPNSANTINSTGQIRLRYKGGPFTDFVFVGQMDATGRRVTGTVTGDGYNDTFSMTK